MDSKKRWSSKEILELTKKDKRGFIREVSDLDEKNKFITFRRFSTDRAGVYTYRVFKETEEPGVFEEVDLKTMLNDVAEYLEKSVNRKRLLIDVVQKMRFTNIKDLHDRIAKEPKVTVGVQKGSCMYLYVRGKKGAPFPLQLTE